VDWRRTGGRARRTAGAVAMLVALAAWGAASGCSSAADAAPSPTTRQLTLATPPTVPAAARVDGVTPHELPAGVTVVRDVAYSDTGRLDVYQPTTPSPDGAPRPLVVMFGGRTSDKAHYSTVAATVAAGGAVVVVADYRATDPPPDPLYDVRCAVHFAVAGADAYGAEPAAVTLVGYGWGALAAVGEGFDGPWKQVAVPATECSVPLDHPPTVRAVVGVVGDFDYYPADDPRAGTYGAFDQVAASPEVPARLLQGVPDQLLVTPEETAAFAAALEAAGHPVTTTQVAVPNLALAGLRLDPAEGLALLDAADHAGTDAAAAEILAAAHR
jgi:hypothetical protein